MGGAASDAAPPPTPQDLHGWRRVVAWTQAHIGPILLIVVPALLIAALSPIGEGLREALFPTKVTVSGQVNLPRGDFPSLEITLDGGARATPERSGSFVFAEVPNGDHRITIAGVGLSPQTIPFTVGAGGDDVRLPEITIEPAVVLVSDGSALPTQAGFAVDFELWVEGASANLRQIESVEYLPPTWLTDSAQRVRIRRESFCVHYVVTVTAAGGWTPTARVHFSDGGSMVIRIDEEGPTSPTPPCSTIVGNEETGPPPDDGNGGGGGSGSVTVSLPLLIGMTVDQAITILEALRLEPAVVRGPSDLPVDTVIAQDPAAGSQVAPGTTVTLILSAGPEEILMPDVTGADFAAARSLLQALGLVVTREDIDCGQEVETVCQQDPAVGSSVTAGDAVTLSVQK